MRDGGLKKSFTSCGKSWREAEDTYITLAKIKIIRDGGQKKHLAPSGN
jgi:hypothetical protein